LTDKVWKLADFGLSSDQSGYIRVEDRDGVGTRGYRAPEVMTFDDRSFTNKGDIWALGCIILELVTGARAFENEHTAIQYYSQSGQTEFGNMRVAIDQYLAGFRLDPEERQWMSRRLVSTLSVDLIARPTA